MYLLRGQEIWHGVCICKEHARKMEYSKINCLQDDFFHAILKGKRELEK